MTEIQKLVYVIVVNYINVTILFFLPFNILKYKGKRVILGYFSSTILTLLFTVIIRNFTVMPVIAKSCFIFTWVFAVIMVCFYGTLKRKTILFLSTVIFMTLAENVSLFMLNIIMPLDCGTLAEYNDAALMVIVLINMIAFIFHINFLMIWKLCVDKYMVKGRFLYIIVPFYHLLLLLMYYEKVEQFDIHAAILGISILAMGILINYVIMYLLRNMEKRVAAEEELKRLNTQRKYEMDYYKMINQYTNQMREVRHEFINQIQTAYMMIQSGNNNEKTRNLLGEACQRVEQAKLQAYSGNSVLDALISVKAMEADQERIHLKVICRETDFTGIKENDLCGLAGNMIDNALEACALVSEENEKRVDILLYKEGDHQFIRVVNTYAWETGIPDFRPISGEDGELNGLGIKLMEEICHKYAGELQMEVMDRYVQVTASLGKV